MIQADRTDLVSDNWARIVIVAYKSADHLQDCVDALAAQSFRQFEAVVVDNDCPERSTDTLRLPDSRFRILSAGANVGFAGGSNLGAKGSSTPWIITLNPDAHPLSDWLAELRAASGRHPDAAVLSSTLIRMDNPELSDGFGDVMSIYGIAWRGGIGRSVSDLPEDDAYVFGACAAAAAYRRDTFERLGGFDEAFFCYLEDVDLAFRIQNAGLNCLQVRRSLVLHAGSASSARDRSYPVLQSGKNGLRVILRNAPTLMLPVMVSGYFLAQVYILLRNIQRPESAARLAGLKEAMRQIPEAWRSRNAARVFASVGSWTLFRRLSLSPLSLRNQRAIKIRPAGRN